MPRPATTLARVMERRQSVCLESPVISADSDMSTPVVTIGNLFPEQRLIVAFQAQRYSVQLQRLAHGVIRIGRAFVAGSVFPGKIQKAGGFVLRRPVEWPWTNPFAFTERAQPVQQPVW